MSKVSHNGPWIFGTYNYMYLQNRQFSNKHSEPTTICSCKTDNKCTAKAHGQNEYSEPTTLRTYKTDNVILFSISASYNLIIFYELAHLLVICPFPAILFSLSTSYNLIIFYELALSLVICPFPAILFS